MPTTHQAIYQGVVEVILMTGGVMKGFLNPSNANRGVAKP